MEKKPFAHLHLHTEYSLLDGAVRIKELFSECKAKNISAVALTDHGNMYGAVKFVLAAKDYNKNNKDFPINPILGCEFYLSEDLTTRLGRPDMGHLVLLAKNQDGYNNLIKLTSVAFLDGFYYKPRIDYKLLKKHSKGLVCLSGCLGGHIQEFLLKGMDDEAEKKAIELKNIFGAEDFYMELQDHGLDEQRKILPLQIELAKKIGIKCAATNDVHYLRKDDEEAHDVLLCVQTGRKVAEPDRLKFPSNNFYLKDYNEMFSAFGNLKKEDITKALDNTIEIANKCNATIIFDQNLMPEHICEEGTDKVELLRKLVYEGINKKYGKMTDALKERADHEIEIISKLGFVDYFLVVWDYCAFCYQNNIPVGPGRGSGAGSIVAYALDITRIDPIRYQLKFERFLNKDRISPPDFDIDFCFNRTEEIIDYVTQKYGQERVSQIATFGTMKPKAAIKDVARALDVPFSEVNNLTKLMPSTISGWFSRNSLKRMFGQDAKEEENAQAIPDLKNIIANDPLMKKVVDIAIKVEGMPRHVSQHAAGVVICKYPISNFVPLAKSSGNIITQFDMKEIEKVGLLKYDFLRLRTLTDIQGAVDMVKESTGKEIDFYAKDFDMDDHSVYEIIASGETDTIFQLESGGMKKLMRDLKPDTLEDVIAGIALYRPGPMDWIPQFVTGKHKPETVKYVVPELEPILKDTYGVPVYQEQVMKICQELAGFTLSQADIIRRAMGKKEMENIIRWKKYFLHGGLSEVPPEIDGAIKKGFDEKTMSDLYDQLTKFADYAFNKSHSAGYAYLSYHTAYLKRYHEPESLAAVLNNRITNSDELKKYIALAKKRGIKVMPPDVNTSGVNFKVLDGKIYYGLGALKGIGVEAMGEVLKKRDAQCGGFKNFYNFVECLEGSALNKRFIESMIYSGALDCFGIKRSQMIDAYPEVVEAVVKDKKAKEDGQFSFFDEQFGMEDLKEVKFANIPEYRKEAMLKYEKEVVGAYISGHPLDEWLDKFKEHTFNASLIKQRDEEEEEHEMEDMDDEVEELRNDQPVLTGGIISGVKRVFTKKGNREMLILTIEDLYGTFEVMLFPQLVDKFRNVCVEDNIVEINGKISLREGQTPIVILDGIKDMKAKEDEPVKEEIKKETLYLKFSTMDRLLYDRVMSCLRASAGNTEVRTHCTEKKKTSVAKNYSVAITDNLLFELKGLIGKQNVVVKKVVE